VLIALWQHFYPQLQLFYEGIILFIGIFKNHINYLGLIAGMAFGIKYQVDVAFFMHWNGSFCPIHINAFAGAYNFYYKCFFSFVFEHVFGGDFFSFLNGSKENTVLLET